jgi:N utilization substance protein B
MTEHDDTSFQRSRAASRLAAVQALYQMDVSDISPERVLQDFTEERWSSSAFGLNLPEPDRAFLNALVLGAFEHYQELDSAIEQALAGRYTIERLEVLLRAVLRAGSYELSAFYDVPTKVVINEYVDLAHAFFSGKEPALVNAVLDRLARTYRSSAIAARHGEE